ncbi:MAG: hypothetical protein SGI96_00740 [Bacteroidota bacterium]|nr:hypothetical protein [Bacteroidota bacterium]
MKKIILALVVFIISHKAISQTCEEREDQLLGMMGGLSAGFLYNTYGLIGSIADGYGQDAYSESTVIDLLAAQKKLADNMIALLDKMITENAFKKQTDKDYVVSCVAIIKGLKNQVQLLINLIKNKTQKNIAAYDEQRNKSWKNLSKLMGVDE